MMAEVPVVRVLAISGSLRRASSNSALINLAVAVAPPDVRIVVYRELAELPPFNPDLEAGETPPPVHRLRAAIDAVDAVLISSPEYAHGVPGVLKNALDWLVGSGELIDKPIALINASTRATHAYASLLETLTTMSARVIADASITIAIDSAALHAGGATDAATVSVPLARALAALAQSARA